MKKLLLLYKYRNHILQLLKYSFAEVEDYKYLSKTEKCIIRNTKEFEDLKKLSKMN